MIISYDEVMKYKAIFLDVGNVIFHDTPVEVAYSYYVFNEMRKYSNIDNNYFFSFRKLQLLNGNWVDELCKQTCIKKTQQIIASSWESVLKIWMDITVPIDGAIKIIKDLSEVNKLVIAANQPEKTMKTLEFYGIKNCFERIYLDAIIGLSKPNLDFYKFILNEVGFMPNEVLMVGDRIDNDIRPSNMLGIHSAWINFKPIKVNIKHIPLEWQEEYYRNVTLPSRNVNLDSDLHLNDIDKARYTANSLYELFDFVSRESYNPYATEHY